MQENKLLNLLTELNKINPVGGLDVKTKLEINSERINKWIMVASVFLFIILLGLVAFHEFISPLLGIFRDIALLIACLTMLLPNIAILIDIAVSAWHLIRFKTVNFRLLLLEAQHDKSNVDSITIFEGKVLKEAKEWLEIKCARIKSKINIFFGNPEKSALFSLVGFGWIVFEQVFNGSIPEEIPHISDDPIQAMILIGVSFLTGICIGAMLLNLQLKRYSYHIEILEMAIKKKQK
jgi:hypothetical protein